MYHGVGRYRKAICVFWQTEVTGDSSVPLILCSCWKATALQHQMWTPEASETDCWALKCDPNMLLNTFWIPKRRYASIITKFGIMCLQDLSEQCVLLEAHRRTRSCTNSNSMCHEKWCLHTLLMGGTGNTWKHTLESFVLFSFIYADQWVQCLHFRRAYSWSFVMNCVRHFSWKDVIFNDKGRLIASRHSVPSNLYVPYSP